MNIQFQARYIIRGSLMFLNGRFQQVSHGIGRYCSQTSSKTPNWKETGSTESNNNKCTVAVTSHLVLHKAGKLSTEKSSRPLVVLYPWLYAKPLAVKKYCDLYHNIGLDVLTVKGKLSHFLWPPQSEKLATELFEYLKTNQPASEKVLVHAFSVGAYNYTVAMKAALERQQETGCFREKVIGQIFDSIVIGTYDNMSNGITELLPRNKVFRKLVHLTLDMYYNTTSKTTKAVYDDLVHHFKMEPIPVPTVLIYAENDPMCDTAAIENMLSEWRSERPDFDVTKLSWPKSTHAAHFKEHREDYLAAWTELMCKLELV